MLGPLGLALPRLSWAAAVASASPRLLVLVELNGGNDGLNMVVPYASETYYRLRPALAIARDQVLQLDQQVGFNPAMEALIPAFKSGELAIVQGMGYPQADRSHFRSIDIWDTGSGSDKVSQRGWLTQVHDSALLGSGFAADAVVIGRNPGPVSGGDLQPIVMASAKSFVAEAGGMQVMPQYRANPTLEYILKVQAEVEQASRGLAVNRPAPPGKFPANPLGRDAGEAARLMIGRPATPIIKLALTGFDTHSAQRGRHDALLKQLAESLAALRAALTEAGVWKNTLVMTYSEFGRRTAQNGSQGTDHGKAAPHLVMGGAIKGGLYGPAPNLDDLDDGDVRMAVDYRSLYNMVLGRWWGLKDAMIESTRYAPLQIV